MSLSDRERAEGFQRMLSGAVDPIQSERAEGFQRLLSSAVTITSRRDQEVTRGGRGNVFTERRA
ncbi:hypothetical protein [Halosimplex halophilum]|uniref:hypothetical protein n=1 Tax=Halosimplex halophilum TaxID=2559572 RepID=UPI00107F4337|nr:hypothetical protein [Halosimplex halophilum]